MFSAFEPSPETRSLLAHLVEGTDWILMLYMCLMIVGETGAPVGNLHLHTDTRGEHTHSSQEGPPHPENEPRTVLLILPSKPSKTGAIALSKMSNNLKGKYKLKPIIFICRPNLRGDVQTLKVVCEQAYVHSAASDSDFSFLASWKGFRSEGGVGGFG